MNPHVLMLINVAIIVGIMPLSALAGGVTLHGSTANVMFVDSNHGDINFQRDDAILNAPVQMVSHSVRFPAVAFADFHDTNWPCTSTQAAVRQTVDLQVAAYAQGGDSSVRCQCRGLRRGNERSLTGTVTTVYEWIAFETPDKPLCPQAKQSHHQQTSCAAAIPNKYGYWSFDDPANLGKDSSGNANDLSELSHWTQSSTMEYGRPQFVPGGRLGGGVEFDSNSIFTRSWANTGTAAFSVAFWVHDTGGYSATYMGVGADPYAPRSSFSFGVENGQVLSNTFGGGGYRMHVPRNLMVGWHHHVWLVEPANYKSWLYVDGGFVGSYITGSGSGPTSALAGKLKIGAGAYVNNNYAHRARAAMDEVYLFTRKITVAEIQCLAASRPNLSA